jgi:DNA-binding CsgD family transcriptional regulator
MNSSPDDSPRLPHWIGNLGLPVWVSDPDRRVMSMNGRAERLLDRPAGECIGRNCYELIQGRDTSHRRFCGPACQIFRAGGARELEPVEMMIEDVRGEHWIQVLVIPVDSPGGRLLVHCALPFDRPHRIEAYMQRVASRTEHTDADMGLIHRLSPRERRVLELLSQDETTYGVAHQLNLSYATVRNHVQHILAKLEVHSIAEAVALWVLVGEEAGAVEGR